MSSPARHDDTDKTSKLPWNKPLAHPSPPAPVTPRTPSPATAWLEVLGILGLRTVET